uniref:Protein kinase domain-containing protein n=1 Tax=Heterorhabditis bacteriophora TaxID=37862 RepID=A0A1I7W6P0_HETBA
METTVIYSGQKFTCDYNKIIGCGSFCQVHPGRSELGREVAVKSTSKSAEIKAAQNEVKFLQKCTAVKANNIVEVYACLNHLDKWFDEYVVVFPKNGKKECQLELKFSFLVYWLSSYLFKFCDLGGSRIVDDGSDMRTLVGTPNCLYPKLAHALAKGQTNKWRTEDGYTTIECDLWSLGCTLFFAAVGSYPFPNAADANVYYEAVSNLPKDRVFFLLGCFNFFGYPTLRSVLEIKEDVDYRLLSTKEIRYFDDSLRLDTLFEEPYIVFPAVSEIIWRPKPWRTGVKAVVALADCDQMSELFEVTICILKQQLSKVRLITYCIYLSRNSFVLFLKTDMLTVTDLTTLPIRFAIYARSQSTAIMPFFENDNDKVLLSRIVETADQATEELEKHTEILNSYCTRIDLLLPTVNSLVLDEYEIPGILDTLNRYYLLDSLDAEFTQPYVVVLVQRCLDRRIKMVNQLFNSSQTSIIHTLLKITREIIQLLYDSSNCRYDVLHRTALIERPFQEMKNCVERITLGTDIDQHNIDTQKVLHSQMDHIRRLLPTLGSHLRKVWYRFLIYFFLNYVH